VPQVAEVCQVMGLSERALRTCCLQVLGMTAAHYLWLRRLWQARQALRQANAASEAVHDVMTRYGFADFRHFATAYRKAFGERPSDCADPMRPGSGRRKFLLI
jgi:AraC-like DNA-binding protein